MGDSGEQGMSRARSRALGDERLRIALDAGSMGWWEYEPASNRFECTAECKAAFGLPPDAEMAFDHLLGAVFPHDRQRLEGAVRAALEDSTPCDTELRVAWPDGDTHWVRVRGELVVEGDARRLVGVTIDVTGRKRDEEEHRRLFDAERDARAEVEHRWGECTRLARAIAELAGAVDPAEVTTIVCRAARELASADGATFVVREGDMVRYVDEDARAPLWKGSQFPIGGCISGWAMLEGASALIEDVFADERVPQGAYRPTFVRSLLMTPVRGSEPSAAIGVYWAERHRATPDEARAVRALAHVAGLAFAAASNFERMRMSRDGAEEASRLKDEFVATLSHELRAPLNSVLGWTRILREPWSDDALRIRAVEAIERNTRSQADLIEDLLDVSRIAAGKLVLESRAVALHEPLRAAVESLRPVADAKGVAIELRSGPEPLVLLGDEGRLRQVFTNLIGNAVKFTPAGGRIDVAVVLASAHVEVSVRDTGRGIVAELLPYVFDRFRQAGGLSRRSDGLGLGLAIVANIVQMHGGSVSAESEGEGLGATFRVRLPVPVPTEPRLPVRGESASPQLCDLPSLEGVRVLAVDDEADVRDLLELVLAGRGAEVRTAASAAEALTIVESWRPDVLLADVGMPETDGYGLILRVRALAPDRGGRVPAAAITAYARTEDRTRALSAGFQMHVGKPVEPAEVVLTVCSLTGRDRSA